MQEAFYAAKRTRGVNKIVFAEALKSAFERIANMGTILPPELQGDILMEKLDLVEQQEENILTLTAGSTKIDDIIRALRRTERPATEPVPKIFAVVEGNEDSLTLAPQAAEAAEGPEEEETDEETVDEQEFLAMLENTDMTEDDIAQTFAELRGREKQRTWKQAKQMRNAQKTSRGWSSSGNKDMNAAGASPAYAARRLSLQDAKRLSRCSKCGRRGHWADACTYPPRTKEQRLKDEASARQGAAGAMAALVQASSENVATFFAFTPTEDRVRPDRRGDAPPEPPLPHPEPRRRRAPRDDHCPEVCGGRAEGHFMFMRDQSGPVRLPCCFEFMCNRFSCMIGDWYLSRCAVFSGWVPLILETLGTGRRWLLQCLSVYVCVCVRHGLSRHV